MELARRRRSLASDFMVDFVWQFYLWIWNSTPGLPHEVGNLSTIEEITIRTKIFSQHSTFSHSTHQEHNPQGNASTAGLSDCQHIWLSSFLGFGLRNRLLVLHKAFGST